MERIIVTLICKEISIANGCDIFDILLDVILFNLIDHHKCVLAQTQTLFQELDTGFFFNLHMPSRMLT